GEEQDDEDGHTLRQRTHTRPSLLDCVATGPSGPVCRNFRSILSASGKCQHIVNSGSCKNAPTADLYTDPWIRSVSKTAAICRGSGFGLRRGDVDEWPARDAAERVAIGRGEIENPAGKQRVLACHGLGPRALLCGDGFKDRAVMLLRDRERLVR